MTNKMAKMHISQQLNLKNKLSKQEEKRIQKNKDSVSSPWADFKRSDIHSFSSPEGGGKSKKLEIYLKK